MHNINVVTVKLHQIASLTPSLPWATLIIQIWKPTTTCPLGTRQPVLVVQGLARKRWP